MGHISPLKKVDGSPFFKEEIEIKIYTMICFTFKAHYIKPEVHLKYVPLLMKVKQFIRRFPGLKHD